MVKRNSQSGVVLFNGAVHTMSPNAKPCDSIVYKDDRIFAVGNSLEKDDDFGGFVRIDLRGACVCPGFVDAHTHFHYFSESLKKVQLAGCKSLYEALGRIANHIGSLKPGEWLQGSGLDISRFADVTWPTAENLDSVTGQRPAAIFTHDHHSLWVNSAALKIAGINSKTKNPPGGVIEKSSNGAPTGMLRENSACEIVLSRITPFSASESQKIFRQACQVAYSKGVTGVGSFDRINAYQFMNELSQRHKLGIRVDYYITNTELDQFENLLGKRLTYGYGDEWLRIVGVKVFMDGALGSQTGFMFQPYVNLDGNSGVEVTTAAQLKSIARRAKKLGLPLAVHAIGDRAVYNTITALTEVSPPPGKRHRIEHLQTIRKKDLRLLKKSGIVASMQPSHLPADIPLINRYLAARANNVYLFKTIAALGVPMAFGSDVPIEPLDPLAGIVDAVRRKSHEGRETLNPGERMTALDAAMYFTAGSAFAAGRQAEYGYLLPGYKADLVVLSRDLAKVNIRTVGEVSVLATVLDGKCVYSSDALALP